MYQSLCVTLGSLPKQTRVYCGHEVIYHLTLIHFITLFRVLSWVHFLSWTLIRGSGRRLDRFAEGGEGLNNFATNKYSITLISFGVCARLETLVHFCFCLSGSSI